MPKNIVLKISQKGAAKTGQALKSVTGSVIRLGAKSALVGAGFAVLSTKLAGDFQKSLLEVSTLMTNVNAKTLPNMSRELRAVASSSGLALSSISKAKYDIVSAGFSSAAESANVLAVASRLAVGGVTSAASAADLLTTALNAYGKTSDDANDVSDILFTTVRLGKTTMDELGQSMGGVLPFAKTMNLSLADVGAVMATLTASGINTAEATTSLKSAIISLSAPADSARDAMLAAGIEVKRFADGTVNIIDTVEQFKGMDPEAIKKFIPNVTAIAGIQTLANNFDVLSKNVEQFETQAAGATEIAFEKMNSAFNTQFSKLKNNMQSIMIEVGNIIIEKIQPAIEQANAEFSKLGNIGWDNIGASISANLQPILSTLMESFQLSFKFIEEKAQITGFKILDFLNPFSDMSASLKKMEELNSNAFERTTEIIGLKFTAMYDDIVFQAGIAAMRQELISQGLEDSEAARALKRVEALQVELEAQREAAGEGGVISAEKTDTAIGNLTREQLAAKMANIQAVNQSKEMIAQGLSETEAAKFVSEQKAQFEANVLSAKLGTVSGALGALSSLNSSAKGSALISKRLAQGSAVIDTYAGANKALAAGPPPWNFIAAAAVIASGLANVVKIESTEFAKGGIVPGTGNRDTVSAMLTPGEVILNKSQQENLVGGMGGITLNITAPLIDEHILDTILPAIQKAQRMNLA
tara:strand:+ start:4569 stop:6668 length:2100 start_codon:yes stop_codon:yes gene_type:complete